MRTRIAFPPPGWFATDARLTVTLDGDVVHDGSFVEGFSSEVELDEGEHELEARIHLAFSRAKRWTFEVPPADEGERWLDVKLAYSRMWGTFRKELPVRVVEGPMDALPEPAREEPPPALSYPVRATWVLLGVLVAVYALEVTLGIDGEARFTPSIDTLVGMGALTRGAVLEGQLFRMLSCTFLHGGFLHLLFNGIALVMAGVIVERLVGSRWFLGLYFVGALAGSSLSLAVNDASLVSVGASGAIMGIFAAGLLVAQTLPSAIRSRVQFALLRVLVPSLLPIFQRDGEHIDFGAHLGGAIAGLVMGALFLRMLRSSAASGAAIDRSPVGTGLAGAFVVASLAAMVAVVVVAYPDGLAHAALMSRLVPDAEIIREQAPTQTEVARWLQTHPDDPRVRVSAAELAYEDERWTEFDAHLARAVEVLPDYEGVFSPQAIQAMRGGIDGLRAQGAIRRQLLPNRDLPTGDPNEAAADWEGRLDAWLRQYPNDPRVRVRAAWRALDAGNLDEAVEQARIGLEHAPAFAPFFPDVPLEGGLRAALASALAEQGRLEEATTAAAPLCDGELGANFQEIVAMRGLCGAE